MEIFKDEESPDGVTVIVERDEFIEVRIGNMTLMIKHNDVGISIDTYAGYPLQDILVRDYQIWFEDIEEEINKDANNE